MNGIPGPRSMVTRPLRVAMVVPPWYELPPAGYGGLEQVCAALVDALVARGHSVTLFGAGRSTGTLARFVPTVAQLQYERLGQTLPELLHVARVNRLIGEGGFDVVHDHTVVGALTSGPRSIPTIATIHSSPTGQLGECLSHVPRSVALVAISDAQRRQGAGLPWFATVYNGLSVNGLAKTRPSTGPVLWLARFNPEKGPDLAIRACAEAGLPLVLAGKVREPEEHRYLREVIEPMAGPDVEIVVNGERQRTDRLLARARCLLLPIRWEEPFGMVLIEAMAVGTPVVALNRGAVPEIVRDGVTGFICDEPEQLPAALRRVDELDPAACAEHVRANFSGELMASGYEAVYQRWAARADLRRSRLG
ncbi:MAG: glycosyltransferase family 4 protein [Micromonosporaceae bacterium]